MTRGHPGIGRSPYQGVPWPIPIHAYSGRTEDNKTYRTVVPFVFAPRVAAHRGAQPGAARLTIARRAPRPTSAARRPHAIKVRRTWIPVYYSGTGSTPAVQPKKSLIFSTSSVAPSVAAHVTLSSPALI